MKKCRMLCGLARAVVEHDTAPKMRRRSLSRGRCRPMLLYRKGQGGTIHYTAVKV